MTTSAVLKDVPHDYLENTLGNWVGSGWLIHHAYPTSEYITTAPNGDVRKQVTHWTIFLETPWQQVTVGQPETRIT